MAFGRRAVILEGFVDMDAVEGCKRVVGLFRRRTRYHKASNRTNKPRPPNAAARAMVNTGGEETRVTFVLVDEGTMAPCEAEFEVDGEEEDGEELTTVDSLVYLP
jgi:hypothetical protein